MSDLVTFQVPAMHCDHCRNAVNNELLRVDGVESVDVDLETKTVVVHGSQLDLESLRAAISAAGYEAV